MKEVLNAVETKEDYDKYNHIVKKHLNDHDLERVLLGVGEYYNTTGETAVDWMRFKTWFILNNPMLKEEKRKMFEAIFGFLDDNTGSHFSDALVDVLMNQYYAERIAFLSMKVAEGKTGDLIDVQKELEEYKKQSGQMEESELEAVTDDLDELLDATAAGNGLVWRMDALNESLGDLRVGNFVEFCGRPESGKSTLLYSEATYMATQLTDDSKVIFFTNEEAGIKVKQRLWSSLLGVDLATLKASPSHFKAEYETLLHGDMGRIIVVENHNLSLDDIRWWLNKEKVSLICIDQLRKVRGLEKDFKGIQRMEALFQEVREIAKEVAPVLTVGQLDSSAENEQYPTMSSMYESKTAAQGELDVMINIGQIDGSVPENARWLNIVKNKMDTPGVEASRHGKHEVTVQATIARFE